MRVVSNIERVGYRWERVGYTLPRTLENVLQYK